MNKSLERRSYYRIRDEIGLKFTVIDEDTPVSGQGARNLDMPLGGLLAEIDREFNQVTNILWQENPTIARALGLLNRKLSIVSARALQDEGQSPVSYEDMMVSLSGSGIGFETDEALVPGGRVLLSLSLRPSNIEIELTGTVSGSELQSDLPERKYWTRVNFERGNEAAQEQLIQHVVQRQCAQIREEA